MKRVTQIAGNTIIFVRASTSQTSLVTGQAFLILEVMVDYLEINICAIWTSGDTESSIELRRSETFLTADL